MKCEFLLFLGLYPLVRRRLSNCTIIFNFQSLNKIHYNSKYKGCPKMLYNCIISLEFKTSIILIHMHSVGNLFLDILLKLHKISYNNRQII